MIYEKIIPDERLSSVVKCYYRWEQEFDETSAKIQSPPSGYEAMVFNYGEPYIIHIIKQPGILSPQAFYSGQNTVNYEMHLQGNIRVFGVVLQPAAFACLFRVSVKGTADRRIPLVQLLGKEAEILHQKLSEAQNSDERVRIMNELLGQKLWLAQLHVDPVDKAARLIMEHKGNLSVQELAEHICCSRRTLERKTGVTPKMMARICRFAHMSYLLMYQKANWQELVFQGGYTDQSHFIKDFQYFNRQKPSAYLQHHRELIKYLK